MQAEPVTEAATSSSVASASSESSSIVVVHGNLVQFKVYTANFFTRL